MALTIERIVRIIGPDAGHNARSDKGRAVVNMTVSNLGIDAFLNPNNLLNTQVLFEFFGHVSTQFLAERLIFTRVQRPITCIRLMGDQHRSGTTTGKQARVRNDKGAFTINGNRTALEDHMVGTIRANPHVVGHFTRDFSVLVPGEVQAVHQATVCIEVPVSSSLVALAIHQERGAGIAEPSIVDAHFHNRHALVILEHSLAVVVVGLVAAHHNGSELGNGIRDAGIGALSGHGAERKRVRTVRPAHEHAVLRGKFGRHIETIGFRSGFGFGNLTHFSTSNEYEGLHDRCRPCSPLRNMIVPCSIDESWASVNRTTKLTP